MYHHRYQPPTNLANKNAAAAFAGHNHSINSYPSSATKNSTNPRGHHSSNANNISTPYTSNSSSYSHASTTSRVTEDRQDVIFRRVRGILNKITPETFDKLSKELVNVGLDSPRTLRGVIYLLFDKALKDLKYSSLYAKLCQELSERAPNFEAEQGPNTFCKFLISKCEDEFERRRKATEDFDRKNELTDEEYEQRAIAKQKMLGNIKFICELGKKRLLQEEILHECIRGLLSKKKERPIQDQAQDLECLCQIMRTIGSLLDIQASRNLMNQYFERIDMFSKKPELPSRIRFMLRDVIDLRNNNWRPRPFQREDNVPQPLSKLREEAGYDPTNGSSIDKFGNNRNLIGIGDLSKLHGNKLSLLLDDEPSFTTSTDFHWGPSYLPLDQSFDPFAMGATPASKTIQNTTTGISQASPQANSLAAQKSANFRVNDPFSEHIGDRRADNRQNLTRPNIVKQTRTTNDLGKFREESSLQERRPFSDKTVVNSRNDFEPPGVRSRQLGFVPYNPPKTRDDFSAQDCVRQPIEPRSPTQQLARGQTTQPLDRTSDRRFDSREIGQLTPRGAPPPPHVQQPPNRPINRFVDQPNSLPVSNGGQDNRDRRPLRQDNNHDQNPRFSNNYRPPRSERPPRRENHFQFERTNHESEINQNWRAGPASSASSATSRHSSNPPPNIDAPTNQRPNSRFPESDGQDRQSTARLRNTRAAVDTTVECTNRGPPPMQPRLMEKEPPVPIPNTTRDVPRHMPRAQQNREGSNSHGPPEHHRTDHIQRSAMRPAMDGRQQPHFERRLNISPPRPRDYEVASRHQPSAPNNSFQSVPSDSRQDPRVNQNDNQETSDPGQLPTPNQVRKVIFPAVHDGPKNQQPMKNAHPNEVKPPSTDRRFMPISRSNNPSIGSDMQDPDRVTNWRKGNNNYNVAPQPRVKTPPKEVVKPPLSTPILPKPLPKINDTNFSLRPSHNLINSRPSAVLNKPSTTNEDKALTNNLNQESPAVNRNDERIASPHPPSSEVSSSNGAANNDSHNRSARDFHVNKFIAVITEHSNETNSNAGRMISKVKELKIPKNYQPDCLVSIIKQSIFKTESDRESTKKLLAHLLPTTFEAAALLNAFKIIFEQLQALEAEIPRVKSLIAVFLSQAILDGILSLEDVVNLLAGGRHHPLFLLCLQKLENSAGQAWLSEKFVNSKIDLMIMLPEVDRSKDRLASILKDRCLGFLDPMLTIEPDLWVQMNDKDPSPTAIYRWIKDNVNPTIQGTPTFAHVLVTCLLRYIHNTSASRAKSLEVSGDNGDEAPESNKSSPSSSSQATADIEKELLSKYQQMLQAILKDKQMQLATLYSLQSFYHGLDFPKGALLRWFHQMYDLNIVDDDVFFTWKEEISDKFPGKGQALFQVNTWLNWLAEAESEEEDEV